MNIKLVNLIWFSLRLIRITNEAITLNASNAKKKYQSKIIV
jgi:hypothetical protein